MRWNIVRVWPSKWTGPGLNAKNNEIAMETLEIAMKVSPLMDKPDEHAGDTSWPVFHGCAASSGGLTAALGCGWLSGPYAPGQSVCPSVLKAGGYLRVFGLWKDASTTYAIRGYFENGGDVAYVVRLCGAGSKPASALWKVGEVDNCGQWTAASGGFSTQYRIKATSPGEWANGTRVTIRYRLRGVSGAPEVDMTIQVPSEPAEYFAGLNLDGLECSVAAQSLFIRLIPDGPAVRSCSGKRPTA